MLTVSHVPADNSREVLDTTVGDLLRQAADAVPDAPALTAGSPDPAGRRTWTWGELAEDAERVARALAGRFEPGEHLAVWAHNVPEWVLIEYGAALAGLVLVTVNPALRAEEAHWILSQSRAAGVIAVDTYRDTAPAAIARDLQPRLGDLREVIPLSAFGDLVASAPASAPLPAVSPDAPAQIQYTSGTTGFPKGARLSHQGITNNARFSAEVFCPEGATMVGPMPLFHTGGCVLSVLGAAARRAHLVLVEQFDPALVLELIETHRAEVTSGVPTMLLAMMAHPEFASRDISSLRTVVSGGAMVPAELVRRIEDALGCEFLIVYGQTEASPAVTWTRPGDSAEDKGTTVGRVLPRTELRIADVSTGETVPVGAEGEILVRGYLTMIDYFDMPDKTAETIDADGWLHTGDLGRLDERGYLRITGRVKEMIIRGGENIFPAEIENRLHEHPSVADVAVVGVPDELWGEQVGAVVVPADPGAGIDPAELTAFCKEVLAPHKVPRLWYTTDAMPLTGSGKVQKFVLVDRITAGELSPVATRT